MDKNLFSSSFGNFSWEYQPWDSGILERKTAKIVFLNAKGDFAQRVKLVNSVIEELKNKKIKYATIRVKANDFLTIHALESEGFRLVDGYIVLQVDINGENRKFSNIREANKEDLGDLSRIAGSSFSDTRFYNDPQIKKDQANNIYAEWVKNSVFKKVADMVLVWEEEGKVCGFTSIKKNGNIALIAVDNTKKGKGIGKTLVESALSQFAEWGVKISSIETQMTNIPALRTYISCGFKVIDSYLTFRWSLYED